MVVQVGWFGEVLLGFGRRPGQVEDDVMERGRATVKRGENENARARSAGGPRPRHQALPPWNWRPRLTTANHSSPRHGVGVGVCHSAPTTASPNSDTNFLRDILP